MTESLTAPVMAGLISGVSLIIAFSAAPIAASHYLITAQKENPLRIDARLVYVLGIRLSCLQQPCGGTVSGYGFQVINDEPMFLLGYSICNIDDINHGKVFSACIKFEGGSSLFRGYFTPYPEEMEEAIAHHNEVRKDLEKWGGETIGDINWNTGDTVSIKVKVAPASVQIADNSERWSYDDSQVVWVDLGKSQIAELEMS